MIPHLGQSDIVTANYSTFRHFLGIFCLFGESKWPPGGLKRESEKNFWQKDVIYLDNSNDTSFRSIRHRNGKLFNFSAFFVQFWSFWGVKMTPRGV